jgi:hypothetical protein
MMSATIHGVDDSDPKGGIAALDDRACDVRCDRV